MSNLSNYKEPCQEETVLHQLVKVKAEVTVTPNVTVKEPIICVIDECDSNYDRARLQEPWKPEPHCDKCSCTCTITKLICIDIPLCFDVDVDVDQHCQCRNLDCK